MKLTVLTESRFTGLVSSGTMVFDDSTIETGIGCVLWGPIWEKIFAIFNGMDVEGCEVQDMDLKTSMSVGDSVILSSDTIEQSLMVCSEDFSIVEIKEHCRL